MMIRKLVRWIRERGDKAIIYDKGCVFTSNLNRPETDVMLNPLMLDARIGTCGATRKTPPTLRTWPRSSSHNTVMAFRFGLTQRAPFFHPPPFA
ncbi:hypothetical protein VCRA2121O157_130135 [Vibrio crassostreae]|nr:hypothetical protein VCRA2113O138_120017 [Vibrio crassostreae]CAK1743075.1 hypothetical protein VCRA2113O140_130017 [Vibrio crassostreae]CAK1781102.1 hypothetical protein VCRA2113O137_150017 [Vibrio crassostreae]CAK2251504.1 hypothetical protein VCRA2116O141_130017 [Vibrio crassostreae]CAK2600559.1 hypothetical protein VCRA2113O23_120029 [Vibrio crassostreae]